MSIDNMCKSANIFFSHFLIIFSLTLIARNISTANPYTLIFSNIIHFSSSNSHIRYQFIELVWTNPLDIYVSKNNLQIVEVLCWLALLCFTYWYWFQFITLATLLPSLFGNKKKFIHCSLWMESWKLWGCVRKLHHT